MIGSLFLCVRNCDSSLAEVKWPLRIAEMATTNIFPLCPKNYRLPQTARTARRNPPSHGANTTIWSAGSIILTT